ncbi:LysR family transcriptional regulator [Dyella monticola]|uniref:LysR family transcriptional regulator n=1 Tax=Dyella monticola TaxID=1927958 RepID=A0A370X658_9GAMM|nr:LysR substrate-binding domain-containing protein [Dyella monticola]RDS83685.1 LysR family transcriptional regulator [Dyella monticola]
MVEVHELNLRHLLAVAAVAEAGSISAASPVVSLSQPALTQALGRLEKQLQIALFSRHPGGMAATEAARLLVPRVRRASSYIARGVQQARRSVRLTALPGVERRVTLSQLRALTEVADGGSYSLAAARSGISQPAVYRAMSELAELVEVPLVQRRGKAVQLTGAATRMLRFARLARSELQAGLDELAALGSQGAGRITLGTLPLARAVLLPRVLARFSRANPGATISVIEGQYLELLGHLREGSLDMIVGAMRNPVPVRDVVQEALFDDQPVIVARSGHPLAGKPLDFSRLLDYPWVISAPGAPLRARWKQMFLERGMEPPRLRIECGSVMVMRGLMLEDDWLTLMSPDQLLIERRAGLLCELGSAGPSVRRRIALTTRGDWHPTRLQAQFVATFKEVCAEREDPIVWPFRYP